MNRTKAIGSLTVIALFLLVQGCGKEATPPPARTAAPPAAAKAEAPSPAAASASGAQASGEDPYKKGCASCHDQGVAGAPKLGDQSAWEPRLKQGMDVLYTVGLKGKPGTAMIAKGGNASLSEDDVRAAVDYMVSKAR
jgi:cytochrome c5